MVKFTTSLDAPTNLTIVATTNLSIELSWDDNSTGEDGFHIYRAKSSGSTTADYTRVDSVEPNVSEYKDYNVETGETHYYRVTAFDESFETAVSNEVSETANLFTDTSLIGAGGELGSGALAVNNVTDIATISSASATAETTTDESGFDVQAVISTSSAVSEASVTTASSAEAATRSAATSFARGSATEGTADETPDRSTASATAESSVSTSTASEASTRSTASATAESSVSTSTTEGGAAESGATATADTGVESSSSVDNSSLISASFDLNYKWWDTQGYYNDNGHPATEAEFDEFFNPRNSGVSFEEEGVWDSRPTWGTRGDSVPAFLPSDGFAFQFQGYFTAPETGTYTFGVDGDDAVDAFVDGQRVAYWYDGHGASGDYTSGSGQTTDTISLTAGERYSFIARHEEGGGSEAISVGWQKPSDGSINPMPSDIYERDLPLTSTPIAGSADVSMESSSAATAESSVSLSTASDAVSSTPSTASPFGATTSSSATDGAVTSASVGSQVAEDNFAETGTVLIGGNNESIANAADSLQVTFDRAYDNPVVIAHMITQNGGQAIDDNVTNITSTTADIFNIEPDLQGHNDEEHSFIVMEQGPHLTPEGYRVEAGTFESTTPVVQGESSPTGTTVQFTRSFDSAPVVLATINSHNSGDFKTVWINNVTASSFDLTHMVGSTNSIANEIIGWVAIDANADPATIGGHQAATSIETGTSTSFTEFSEVPDAIAEWNTAGDFGWANGDSLTVNSDNWEADSVSGGSNTWGHVAFESDSILGLTGDLTAKTDDSAITTASALTEQTSETASSTDAAVASTSAGSTVGSTTTSSTSEQAAVVASATTIEGAAGTANSTTQTDGGATETGTATTSDTPVSITSSFDLADGPEGRSLEFTQPDSVIMDTGAEGGSQVGTHTLSFWIQRTTKTTLGEGGELGDGTLGEEDTYENVFKNGDGSPVDDGTGGRLPQIYLNRGDHSSFHYRVSTDVDGNDGLDTSTGIVPEDEIVHVVGVVDLSDPSLTVYKNGEVFDQTTLSSNTLGSGTAPIELRNDGRTFEVFKLDDIRWYDRALSQSEIRELTAGYEVDTNLVHNWHMDEGEGLTVRDSVSGNGGTVSGAEYSTPISADQKSEARATESTSDAAVTVIPTFSSATANADTVDSTATATDAATSSTSIASAQASVSTSSALEASVTTTSDGLSSTGDEDTLALDEAILTASDGEPRTPVTTTSALESPVSSTSAATTRDSISDGIAAAGTAPEFAAASSESTNESITESSGETPSAGAAELSDEATTSTDSSVVTSSSAESIQSVDIATAIGEPLKSSAIASSATSDEVSAALDNSITSLSNASAESSAESTSALDASVVSTSMAASESSDEVTTALDESVTSTSASVTELSAESSSTSEQAVIVASATVIEGAAGTADSTTSSTDDSNTAISETDPQTPVSTTAALDGSVSTDSLSYIDTGEASTSTIDSSTSSTSAALSESSDEESVAQDGATISSSTSTPSTSPDESIQKVDSSQITVSFADTREAQESTVIVDDSALSTAVGVATTTASSSSSAEPATLSSSQSETTTLDANTKVVEQVTRVDAPATPDDSDESSIAGDNAFVSATATTTELSTSSSSANIESVISASLSTIEGAGGTSDESASTSEQAVSTPTTSSALVSINEGTASTTGSIFNIDSATLFSTTTSISDEEAVSSVAAALTDASVETGTSFERAVPTPTAAQAVIPTTTTFTFDDGVIVDSVGSPTTSQQTALAQAAGVRVPAIADPINGIVSIVIGGDTYQTTASILSATATRVGVEDAILTEALSSSFGTDEATLTLEIGSLKTLADPLVLISTEVGEFIAVRRSRVGGGGASIDSGASVGGASSNDNRNRSGTNADEIGGTESTDNINEASTNADDVGGTITEANANEATVNAEEVGGASVDTDTNDASTNADDVGGTETEDNDNEAN